MVWKHLGYNCDTCTHKCKVLWDSTWSVVGRLTVDQHWIGLHQNIAIWLTDSCACTWDYQYCFVWFKQITTDFVYWYECVYKSVITQWVCTFLGTLECHILDCRICYCYVHLRFYFSFLNTFHVDLVWWSRFQFRLYFSFDVMAVFTDLIFFIKPYEGEVLFFTTYWMLVWKKTEHTF